MAFNSIILDTDRYVRELRRLGAEVSKVEGRHFVTDILEDLFSCFTNAKTVHAKLSALITEITTGKYEYGYTVLNEQIGTVLWELGIDIYQQLRRLNAFYPDGTLPFYYFAVPDTHFHDILLLRLYDLPEPSLNSALDAEYARLRQGS